MLHIAAYGGRTQANQALVKHGSTESDNTMHRDREANACDEMNDSKRHSPCQEEKRSTGHIKFCAA